MGDWQVLNIKNIGDSDFNRSERLQLTKTPKGYELFDLEQRLTWHFAAVTGNRIGASRYDWKMTWAMVLTLLTRAGDWPRSLIAPGDCCS